MIFFEISFRIELFDLYFDIVNDKYFIIMDNISFPDGFILRFG